MTHNTLKEIRLIVVVTIGICVLWFWGPNIFVILQNLHRPIASAKNLEGKIFFNSDRNGMEGQSILYYYEGKMYPVHQGLQPKFNEELGKILYYGGINKGGLWVVDLKSEKFQKLPNTEDFGIMGFDWSKDGKKICFMGKKQREKTYNLYTMDFDGENQKKITNFDHDYAWSPNYPRWSPDSKKITFEGPNLSKTVRPDWAKTDLHPGTLYVINSDGTGMKRLFEVSGEEDKWVGGRTASWSPDGKKIVFASSKTGENKNHIYICNADGAGIRQITDSPYIERKPVFSPDGTQIAYVAYPRGIFMRGSEIYVVNVDGTNKRRVTPPKLLRQGLIGLKWADHDNPQWCQ